MYEKRLYRNETKPAEIVISKEERYELIVEIARKMNNFGNQSATSNKTRQWEFCEVELDFDDHTPHYN